MEKSARPLLLIAFLSLTSQIVSATWLVSNPTSPNASAVLASSIVERGEFAVRAWPRTAKTPSGAEEPLRAYHLPAEPLYLAAGFRFLPSALRRYLHVPITVLFVTAVAAVGVWVGGRVVGLLAGALAMFDPFVLVHGPVWDDAFLGAALEWTVLAVLVRGLAGAGQRQLNSRQAMAVASLIAAAAATAALTRSSSQVLIGLVATVVIANRSFRPIRTCGWAAIAGLALALTVWGARNQAVLAEFFVGSSHDGITLFESNFATARPSMLRTGIAESYELEDLGNHFRAVASMTELDANRYFTRQAVAYAMNQPADVLTTAGLKLFASLTGVNLGRHVAARRNLVALVWNVGLIIAGVVGWLWLSRDRVRKEAVLLCYAGAIVAIVTCLSLLAGPVGLRYRISAAPLLYLGAAVAVVKLLAGGRPHTASRRD